MTALIHSDNFKSDYQKLKNITLNPERHSAANAFEHCEQVAQRAEELARLNHCNERDTAILHALAKMHDIGKIHGTAKPEESLVLLESYGEVEAGFFNLVKYHDINLPWFIAKQKGQAPGDKSWKKLINKVDIRLLCLFMIADRVDCPGGWQSNDALVWFLEQVQQRGYLASPIITE